MPTGYTADVGEGKLTDFRAFALRCSRAFGALVMMREEAMDAPIPDEFAPSDYHAKALTEAQQRLATLKAMKPSEIAEASARDYAKTMAEWRESTKKRERTKANYEAMLHKVARWKPPTPDHAGLKEFMFKQLRESIDVDCNERTAPEATSRDEWYLRQIEMAARDIKYHTAEHAEEIKRAADRTAWVKSLKESL